MTAAGSILTVEARHNAFFRLLNRYTPFPQPFDTPLSARDVVTIVSPFFKSCPAGSAPTIPGFPALQVSSTKYALGSQLAIAPANASAVNTEGTVYCGFASWVASFRGPIPVMGSFPLTSFVLLCPAAGALPPVSRPGRTATA